MANVVAAYAVAWTAMMVFLLTAVGRQKKLRRQIEALRENAPRD